MKIKAALILGQEQGRAIVPDGQASYYGVTNMHLHSACQDLKLSSDDVFKDHAVCLPVQKEVQTPVSDANYGHEASGLEESLKSNLPPNCINTNSEEALSISIKNLNNSTDLKEKFVASEIESHGRAWPFAGGNILNGNRQVHTTSIDMPITDGHASVELPNPSYKSSPSAFQLEQASVENHCEDGIYAPEGVAVEKVPNKIDNQNEKGITMESPDISSQDARVVGEQCEMINKSDKFCDGLLIGVPFNLKTDSNEPILDGVMGGRRGMDVFSNHQGSGKLQAGRERKTIFTSDTFLISFQAIFESQTVQEEVSEVKRPLISIFLKWS